MGVNNTKTVTLSEIDLLRVVANELKLPLINIQATASMLAEGQYADGEIPEQNLRMLINSSQALDMIDGLLLAGKVQTNQTTLELDVVNSASILREVTNELKPLAARYDRTLHIRSSSKLQPIAVNRNALKLSLNTMLSGIIKSSSSEVIELSTYSRNNMVVINLKDDGEPITSKTVDTVMASLGRQTQPVKSLLASSGLGIYVAQTLIAAMSGDFLANTINNHRSITFRLMKSEQLSLL